MVLLVLVLDDPLHLDKVLDAWLTAGVKDVTILDSTGVQRRRKLAAGEKKPPFFLGMSRLVDMHRYAHNTLFSVIDDETIISRVAEATQRVIGDLSGPHTGVLFTLPVLETWGVPKNTGAGGSCQAKGG